ncbi:MAG: hypothetical protein K0R67_1396 [Paenibacillus sp.]|nr:hypothetical protein [Paenibacillus sp.]
MKGFRKLKRFVIVMLIIGLMTTGWSTAFAADVRTDSQGHWAEQQLAAWLSKGYIQGYEDGSLRPDNPIKRGELLALINRLNELKDTAAVTFNDVPVDHWAYSEVAKAVKAGYIEGYEDNSIRIDNPISRQELAVMVARLLKLSVSPDSTASADKFMDAASMPDWSKQQIGVLASIGVINGYEDGSFKPAGLVTRAEVVVMLERASHSAIYYKAGVYGPTSGTSTITGNVNVTAAGVTLQNMRIEGDLTLGEGIGEGDVTLKNVTITGKTRINGGGANSIHLVDSLLLELVINKQIGIVRIIASGSTSVQKADVQSGAIVESDGITSGEGIQSVTLSALLPKGAQITLQGNYEDVQVFAKGIMLEIPKGTIDKLTIDKQSDETKLIASRDASILVLVLDAAAAVFGQGSIKLAIINAEGIEFELTPLKLEIGSTIDKGTPIKIGGKETTLDEAVKPTLPSTGGNGSVIVTPPPILIPDVSLLVEGAVTESVYRTGQRVATVGDSVYAVSDQTGALYLVPGATSRYITMLDYVVSLNKGIRLEVTADEKVSFSTAGLQSGDYVLIGLSATYGFSEYDGSQELRLSAIPTTALSYDSLYVYSNSGSIDIGFNQNIYSAFGNLAALKESVTYATHADSVTGNTYTVTKATYDQFEIRGNELRITFATPPVGKVLLTIAGNSLMNSTNTLLANDTITEFDFGPGLSIVSPAPYQIGSNLTVVTNKTAKVYLIKRGISVTKADIERAVQEGKARKVPTSANIEAILPTAGLSSGAYVIIAWGGQSTSFWLQ